MEDIKDIKYFSLKKLNNFLKENQNNATLAKELTTLILDDDQLISMRASWALLHLSFRKPEMINPVIPKLIRFLKSSHRHTGAIRNVIRIFQDIKIPEKYSGELFDLCIGFLKNTTLPHAVRVFSLYVLTKICTKYPELKVEIELILSEFKTFPQPPSMTAAIKKCSKIMLKL